MAFHDLPTWLQNGIPTVMAAAVTGIFGLMSGEHTGKRKGKAEFINAVENAASLVITRLEALVTQSEAREAQCVLELAAVKEKQAVAEREHAALRLKIDALMAGPIAPYTLGGDH